MNIIHEFNFGKLVTELMKFRANISTEKDLFYKPVEFLWVTRIRTQFRLLIQKWEMEQMESVKEIVLPKLDDNMRKL